MMSSIRTFATFLLLLAAAGGLAGQPSASQRQSDALAVLRSNSPAAAKAAACKQLALCGNRDAVPVLVPLLADPQLASSARIALEAIPDPAADEALRRPGQAAWQVARRRDQLDRRPPRREGGRSTGPAHCGPGRRRGVGRRRSLGRIGTAEVTSVLGSSLAAARPETRAAAAEGAVLSRRNS